MTDKKESNLINFTGLWPRVSEKGNAYLSGLVKNDDENYGKVKALFESGSALSVNVFKVNDVNKKENGPSHNVTVSIVSDIVKSAGPAKDAFMA